MRKELRAAHKGAPKLRHAPNRAGLPIDGGGGHTDVATLLEYGDVDPHGTPCTTSYTFH